jgi:hypothetical protein
VDDLLGGPRLLRLSGDAEQELLQAMGDIGDHDAVWGGFATYCGPVNGNVQARFDCDGMNEPY